MWISNKKYTEMINEISELRYLKDDYADQAKNAMAERERYAEVFREVSKIKATDSIEKMAKEFDIIIVEKGRNTMVYKEGVKLENIRCVIFNASADEVSQLQVTYNIV